MQLANERSKNATKGKLAQPPSMKEINAEMPCQFSCCQELRNGQHCIDMFSIENEGNSDNKKKKRALFQLQ